VLLSVCWWRVVLDESQRVSKSANLTTRTCCALPRVHSWLLSGTPVGNVVEDLLGQLLFLRVEPFCRMGEGVDNFWEREVSSRFRALDEDALEIVDELLGAVMMRHSKAQTLADAEGVPQPIVALPQMSMQEVAIELEDPSERAVYLALEAHCQEEVSGSQSTTGSATPFGEALSPLQPIPSASLCAALCVCLCARLP
jgi:SNF2 family DNA or RNA helicase